MFQLYMNDALVASDSNVRIGVGSSSYGPYAKYGPYVFGSSNFATRIMYADGIKWGYEGF